MNILAILIVIIIFIIIVMIVIMMMMIIIFRSHTPLTFQAAEREPRAWRLRP